MWSDQLLHYHLLLGRFLTIHVIDFVIFVFLMMLIVSNQMDDGSSTKRLTHSESDPSFTRRRTDSIHDLLNDIRNYDESEDDTGMHDIDMLSQLTGQSSMGDSFAHKDSKPKGKKFQLNSLDRKRLSAWYET